MEVNSGLSASLQTSTLDNHRLDQAFAKVSEDLTSIHSSWSWKISKPVRKLEQLIKPVSLKHIAAESLPVSDGAGMQNKERQLDSSNEYLENINMLNKSSPYPAHTLKSLLALQDSEFIEAAYLVLLKRLPDIDGSNHYLGRLRDGVPKIKILEQLLNSTEGKTIGANLPRLRSKLMRRKLVHMPLLSVFLIKKFFDNKAKDSLKKEQVQVPIVDAMSVPAMGVDDSVNSEYVAGTNTSVVEHEQVIAEPKTKKKIASEIVQVELDDSLKALLTNSSEVFWAGDLPPFAWMKASSRIYDPKYDYRLPADFHQRFDLVYLTERDLGFVKAWPLVIDEALRLLAPGGTLVIRVTNTQFLSNFELKNLIACWAGLEMLFEHTFDAGPSLFAVKNTKSSRRPVEVAGFSFGVITDGKRPELLRKFIESVSAQNVSRDDVVEIIVCGPESLKAELDKDYEGIVFVNQPDEFQALGWITKKKNLIVQAAAHENLIIAHDRYLIQPDFIENLKKYGGDFSVISCRQTRLDGRRMPDWVTLGSDWILTSPATLEYGDWTRYVFINGGIIIAKRQVLKQVSWNELLFWGQAEDVELTRRLRSAGYVARCAREIEVVSATMRQGLMDGFEAMPMMPDKYMLPGIENPIAHYITPIVGYGKLVKFGARWGQTSAQMGVYVDTSWQVESNWLSLPTDVFGEITFKLPSKPNGTTRFTLKVESLSILPIILINDIETVVSRVANDELLIEIPMSAYSMNNISRMHVINKTDKFKLLSLVVLPPEAMASAWTEGKQHFIEGNQSVGLLAQGWSQPEYWGCWLNGVQADLIMYVERSDTDVVIEGFGRGFVRPPFAETFIGVMVNGVALSHFSLNGHFVDQRFVIIVPKRMVIEATALRITFMPQDPCSPQEIGLSQDARLLSMGLVSLAILKS